MPREVLTTPVAGLFGKLPATGDFVARGLPDGFRRQWDAWVTRHLASRLRTGADWPQNGLRFRLTSGGRVAAGVVIASRDSAGRAFPLSLVLIGDALPGPEGLDGWCDAAVRAGVEALAEGRGPDWLWQRLEGIAAPEDAGHRRRPAAGGREAPARGDGRALPVLAHGLGKAPLPTLPDENPPLLLWTESSGPAAAAAEPGEPDVALTRILPVSSG